MTFHRLRSVVSVVSAALVPMPAPPAADPAPDDYVSPAYLAARYQVTPRTIRNLYRRHELPGMRVGRQIRVKMAEASKLFERTATP